MHCPAILLRNQPCRTSTNHDARLHCIHDKPPELKSDPITKSKIQPHMHTTQKKAEHIWRCMILIIILELLLGREMQAFSVL